MIEKEMKLINKLGLHARAASSFVREAEKYDSKVEMEKDGIRVNAKSIMGILMLAAPVDSVIQIIVTGEDEEMCMAGLSHLIADRFGEKE